MSDCEVTYCSDCLFAAAQRNAEALAGLLARSRRDSPAGRQLRRMAYRAGLPV
jgi:hypothetical protein